MNNLHPETVLETLLKKGGRSDKRKKLLKLHELCQQEYKSHSPAARDLSLANISRVAELAGLFKARTIYNTQSRDYAELINSWAIFSGPVGNPHKKEHQNLGRYAFLERVEDPAIRSLCHFALIERDKIKSELDLLKSQSQIIVDMRPLGKAASREWNGSTRFEPKVNLTSSERKALEAAVDPKFLREKNWEIGPTGEIVDERGRFVFNPGFATALKKALKGMVNE